MCEDEIVKYCKRCRKRIANRKAKWNKSIKFCSKKCSNRYNGEMRRGTPKKQLYRVYTGYKRKDKNKYVKAAEYTCSVDLGPELIG